MSKKVMKPQDNRAASVVLALVDVNVNHQYHTAPSLDAAVAEMQAMVDSPKAKDALARIFHEGMNSVFAAIGQTARALLEADGHDVTGNLSYDSAEASAALNAAGDALTAKREAEEAARAAAEAAQAEAKTETTIAE